MRIGHSEITLSSAGVRVWSKHWSGTPLQSPAAADHVLIPNRHNPLPRDQQVAEKNRDHYCWSPDPPRNGFNTRRTVMVNDTYNSQPAASPSPEGSHAGPLRLPKRTSLVSETVLTLKEWIVTGALTKTLPGELHLKDQLGVGRDTLRYALKLLEGEGWISSSKKGCQRGVCTSRLSTDGLAAPAHLPVTFLSPHPVEHRVTLLELEDTRLRLAEQGRTLRFVSPGIFQLKNPDRQLERLVEAYPSSAWILFITTEAIQRWFEKRGIPTLLYELPFPGVNLPFVVSNWEGAAFHAGIQLLRQEHQAIGLLEYRKRRPGLLAIERGLERAMASANAPSHLALFKDDQTPLSVARSLESAFNQKNRPTALVLTRAAQLLTCYSWMASRGIRVPADVSIVSLANDSWFADLHPPVCYYQPNSKLMSRSIAERVVDLVTAGQTVRKSMHLQLEYVPGTTIGPVPACADHPQTAVSG